MNKIKLAYLAGVIDSDGTINIYKSGGEYKLRFYVVNTRRVLIDWLKKNFDGYTYQRKSTNPKWKDKYEWVIESASAERILKEITPYLVIKRKQAGIAKDFRNTFNRCKYRLSKGIIKKREMFYQQMKLANSVGNLD